MILTLTFAGKVFQVLPETSPTPWQSGERCYNMAPSAGGLRASGGVRGMTARQSGRFEMTLVA